MQGHHKMTETELARALRLAVVTNVWRQGKLTEEQARDCLCRPLAPGKPETFYDDADLLGAHYGDAVAQIIASGSRDAS